MTRLLILLAIGMGTAQLLDAQMYDPFRKTAKTSAQSTEGLRPPPPVIPAIPLPPALEVGAVMNDRAFINGAWYRVGERVDNHEVTYIDSRFVGLREGKRLKMIGVGASRRVLGTKDVR